MWRNIIVQAVWQILVLLMLMYLGVFMFFDETFNIITEKERIIDAQGNTIITNRLVLNTIVFHTFVLMCLFNQINCRVVDSRELNVFKTLFNNIYFWIVFGLELILQHIFLFGGATDLGSALFGTTTLSPLQTLSCWILGASPLLVHVIGKKIPLRLFDFTRQLDIEKEKPTDKVSAWVDRSRARVSRSLSSLGGNGEEEERN